MLSLIPRRSSIGYSLVNQLHYSKLNLSSFSDRVPSEIFVHVSKPFQKELRIQTTIESEHIQFDALQVLVIKVSHISLFVLYQRTTFSVTFIVVYVTFISIF